MDSEKLLGVSRDAVIERSRDKYGDTVLDRLVDHAENGTMDPQFRTDLRSIILLATTPENGLREALAFYRDAFTDDGEPTRALLDDQGATALAVLHPNTRLSALQHNTGERGDG